MFGRALAVPLALFGLAGAFHAPTSRQGEVKSAAATIVAKTMAVETVYVENLRDNPLETWQIDLVASADPNRTVASSASDHSHFPRPSESGKGPIKPRETRAIAIPLHDKDEPTTARLTLAVFEDGYAEGTPSALEQVTRSREGRAADLAWWLLAFSQARRSSDQDARQYLLGKAYERTQSAVEDPSGMRSTVRSILQGDRPVGWVLTVAENLRTDADAELRDMTRYLERSVAPDTGAKGRSANVRSTRTTGSDFLLRIENLSGVPIEAWEVDIYDSPNDPSPKAAQGADYCVSPRSPRGVDRRIQPHEAREEPIGHHAAQPGASPVAKLSFVMFDDLSFEGSAASRDRFLRSRERTADDMAYWIHALTDATSLRSDQVKAFLESRIAERRRQAELAGRPGGASPVDDAINLAERSPEMFASVAGMKMKMMEEQRQALLRHVKPR